MNQLKEMKLQSMITAALYVILGIILIIYPETTAQTLCYVVGVASVVIGIFTVLAYLFRDVQKNYYRNDFIVGTVEVFLGAFVLYKAALIIELIPFILGILVAFSGLSKLQNCIDIRRMNQGTGLVLFIVSMINIIYGIVIVVVPFATPKVLFIVIAVGLLFSGVTDTVATIFMAKKIKGFMEMTNALTQEPKEIESKESKDE